ncbi:acyl-CoA synthetase [Haloferax marisrubri]|uniref:AMP-dependent synthetase n=1 Tax=Haloferax marisrubri TaxID=1544719 RepID=A0A2P4NLZ9_9EURY|nr:AMP-binding protein [Haloferax marisrubri]POG54164.1 hypothetical protein AUR65_015960 [Haloferax marisrubri]
MRSPRQVIETPTGYTVTAERWPDSYQDLCEQFTWEIPDDYSIPAAIFDFPDDERASDVAVLHRKLDGSEEAVTYEALDSASSAVSRRLAEADIEPGDRVATCGAQSPWLLALHLGILKRGAIVVPISVLLGAETLEYVLSDADPAMLCIEAPALERFGTLPKESEAPVERLEDVVKPQHPGTWDTENEPSDGNTSESAGTNPAFLLYTSGSTGKPKGVIQDHQYLIGSLSGYQLWYQLLTKKQQRSARVWTPAEWAWAGALFDVCYPTLAVGGTVVSKPRRTGFDPKQAVEFLEDGEVTHAFFPPTALRQARSILDTDITAPSALQTIMCGGEPLSEDLKSWVEETLEVTVNEAYGQTEANAIVGQAKPAYDLSHEKRSTGCAYPGHRVAVETDEGIHETENATGELLVDAESPSVFSGYWNRPEATDATFTDSGWLRTGDIATISQGGEVTVQGRKDDVILSSGYRISPTEVEAVVESLPEVQAVAVGGVKDEDRGERVKAVVVPTNGAKPEMIEERIQDVVTERLGPYKKPREIQFVDRLPELRTGKLDRDSLFE